MFWKNLTIFFDRIRAKEDDWYWLGFFWVLGLAAYNFFTNLGMGAIEDWDEARGAVSAYEMMQNHNYIASFWAGKPDLWNLKPPLGLWCIIAGYKIFGLNAVGLRFYSAAAGWLCVLMTMVISRKYGGRIAALLAGLILTTSWSFVFVHGARYGDYSSLLVLFFVFFIFFVLEAEKRLSYSCGAGLTFSLAFLLYGFSSAQFLIFLFFYGLTTGVYRQIPWKNLLGFGVFALMPLVVWALLRWGSNEGEDFLKQMFFYDVVQRLTTPIEGHGGPLHYYLTFLIWHNHKWTDFVIVSAVFYGLSSGLWKSFSLENRWLLAVTLGILVPLTIFSISRSKLDWYINPIFPCWAMLGGWVALGILKERRYWLFLKIAFVVLFIGNFWRAEKAIQRNFPKNFPVSFSQDILTQFKKDGVPAGSDIYSAAGWGQSDRFVAEAEDGLNPRDSVPLSYVLRQRGYFFIDRKRDAGVLENPIVRKLKVIEQNQGFEILELTG